MILPGTTPTPPYPRKVQRWGKQAGFLAPVHRLPYAFPGKTQWQKRGGHSFVKSSRKKEFPQNRRFAPSLSKTALRYSGGTAPDSHRLPF
ncbi:MAG: hypothetical protein A4E54_00664 [Pelotomaculum sp. PtaB.Bin117]|nr:MAG: hypothetical protein A4E54_00664 [Pelotomaculum sp. PtaB.Bin117]OPY63926.1 MAG: hypothetical protein A4E56_00279 [Pelotomaculum sp. PtaU1.Bin065]